MRVICVCVCERDVRACVSECVFECVRVRVRVCVCIYIYIKLARSSFCLPARQLLAAELPPCAPPSTRHNRYVLYTLLYSQISRGQQGGRTLRLRLFSKLHTSNG